MSAVVATATHYGALLHFLLKFSLLATLLFAAVIGLIHAQPYDDGGLHEFLTPPEGCPAPCFMGIRPGMMTANEALTILEAHEWVERVRATDQMIAWEWSGSQAAILNPIASGQLTINPDNIVNAVRLPTIVPIADFLLTFGRPTTFKAGRGTAAGATFEGLSYQIAADYESEYIAISAEVMYCIQRITSFPAPPPPTCRLPLEAIWQTNATLIIRRATSGG